MPTVVVPLIYQSHYRSSLSLMYLTPMINILENTTCPSIPSINLAFVTWFWLKLISPGASSHSISFNYLISMYFYIPHPPDTRSKRKQCKPMPPLPPKKSGCLLPGSNGAPTSSYAPFCSCIRHVFRMECPLWLMTQTTV
jgi:hypothetical protein